MRLRGAWAWLTALAVCPWACGGGASITDVCEKVVACDDSQTVEECVEETEEVQQNAEAEGCGDELDDFVDCADDTLDCVDGEVQFDCNSELTELFLCTDGIGSSCGFSCSAEDSCTCSVGPNTGEACCQQGTSCQAQLSCEDDCCD